MHQTSKYDSRLYHAATLMMLAAYLFFAIGDITIEIMHKSVHALQSTNHSHHTHTHHQHSHAHGHSHGQHQHEVLGFLKLLLDASTNEDSTENVVKVDVDKHVLAVSGSLANLNLRPEMQQQFNAIDRLAAKHIWPKPHPPQAS